MATKKICDNCKKETTFASDSPHITQYPTYIRIGLVKYVFTTDEDVCLECFNSAVKTVFNETSQRRTNADPRAV